MVASMLLKKSWCFTIIRGPQAIIYISTVVQPASKVIQIPWDHKGDSNHSNHLGSKRKSTTSQGVRLQLGNLVGGHNDGMLLIPRYGWFETIQDSEIAQLVYTQKTQLCPSRTSRVWRGNILKLYILVVWFTSSHFLSHLLGQNFPTPVALRAEQARVLPWPRFIASLREACLVVLCYFA